MKSGMVMDCADGKRRLCFPVLCQHIGDMEEQWLITLTISPTCPKCHHRGRGDDGRDLDMEWRQDCDSLGDKSRRRTDYDASQCRSRHAKDPSYPLKRWGYHPELPYSRDYPHGGVLDAVGPDLLHQISKCWYDYALQTWFWPMMVNWWGNKKKGKVAEHALKLEFDSRYTLIPTYPGCRRFPDGILDTGHAWAVFEQKSMMKVIIAVLDGICPSDSLEVMRDYLHMHMLSHYETHTEQSLEYLGDAIETFFTNLHHPDGIFVRTELITPDYEPQKLHYFRHYVESVRSKGSLPSYSTDRTEIWHKPLKRAYQRSNKKEDDAMRFILRDHATLSAFQNMIYEFNAADKKDEDDGEESGGRMQNGDGGDDCDGEGETRPDSFDDSSSIRSSAYDTATIFTWPKTPRFPNRRASDSERDLPLGGFQDSLRRFLREQVTPYDDPDPRVKEFNSIRMSYPSFPEHEITASVEPVPSASGGKVSANPLSADTRRNCRINANTFSRHETVVVKTEPPTTPRTIHGMTFRRVVQILLLFKCQAGAEEHELAYVSRFETTRIASATASGMYLVKRTKKCSVIRVTDIELPVHLMPKFGSVIGDAAKAKRAMDEAKEKDRMWRQSNNYCGSKTWNMTDFILDYYNEFWLNIWVDRHLYKKLY